MRKSKGFTLIELIMVIVILGLLAATALPKYFDLVTKANESAELGVVGGVRAGLATYYADKVVNTGTGSYPALLDAAAADSTCGPANKFFTEVLTDPVTDGKWKKTADASKKVYQGPNNGTYTYDNSKGTFQ